MDIKLRKKKDEGKKGEIGMKQIIRWLLLVCICVSGVLHLKCNAADGGIPVGGIRILMTDITGQPLEGASFQVLRFAGDAELADSGTDKIMVKIGEEFRIMVVESFWTSVEMTGGKQSSIKTASDGTAAVYGLNYGTYYLLETGSPVGYNRIRDPICVNVHKYSHLSKEDAVRDDTGKVIDNTLHIVNVRYTLPDTGTWSVVQLAAVGTGILFSSAALILLMGKRK